nr:hypothetical protein BaRGS_019807 [Batillaria attramentaria]
MNVEDDGKANMVFLKNSNAMGRAWLVVLDAGFLRVCPIQPHFLRRICLATGSCPARSHSCSFRIFSGRRMLKMRLRQAIGRPVLPPYWALGYQLSRWGYKNITDMQMVIDRNRAAGIPYDVQWADIDSLYKEYVFTYDKQEWAGLPNLVKDLHDNHQHFVVIVDPGIGSNATLIEEAKQNSPGYNMYQDGEDAGIFVKQANGSTLIGEVWPGLTAYPDFTKSAVEPCLDILGADPEGKMFDKTICMNARQEWGQHYDVHSLYAHSMAMRTNSVLKKIFPGKRPWTMTRSSFAGTGHYATKWMGDNQARWPAMHWSIIGIFEFSMFGFAMHQDPGAFDQRFVDIVKQPLMTRYKFLPYLYTQLFKATLHGDTVMRPLVFEFPRDLIAREIDRQFLIGPAVLVSPVLEPGNRVAMHKNESYVTLDTPLDKFNLHVRGGHVIPWQTPALTTYESRQNPMGLIVALDGSGVAEGDLYWDDGESEVTDTSYSKVEFKMDKVRDGCKDYVNDQRSCKSSA